MRFLRSSSFAGVLVVLFWTSVSFASGPSPEPADIIITNARIYTVNPQQEWAEAIAIHGEKIVAISDNATIETHRGKRTRVIDAHRRLILPGFTDCHTHFLDGSLSILQVDLDDATRLADVQQRVKDYAAAHPELFWVLG